MLASMQPRPQGLLKNALDECDDNPSCVPMDKAETRMARAINYAKKQFELYKRSNPAGQDQRPDTRESQVGLTSNIADIDVQEIDEMDPESPMHDQVGYRDDLGETEYTLTGESYYEEDEQPAVNDGKEYRKYFKEAYEV